MVPAPMLAPGPISASPTYARWGTFAPSPMSAFLVSTKVPMCAPAPGLAGPGLLEDGVLTDDGVHQPAVRSDDGAGADCGAALEDGAGQQAHLGFEVDRRVDVGRVGVGHRDAFAHPIP